MAAGPYYRSARPHLAGMSGTSTRARVTAPSLFTGPGRGKKAYRPDPRARRGMGDIDPAALPYGPARNFGSPAVEAWRSLVEQYAGDLPVDFLMAWIAYESGGNPCEWTRYQEAGIFQLMPPDNIARAGTTMAAQHPVPPCVAGAGSSASKDSLPDDIQREQVRAGVAYVNYCRTYAQTLLTRYGYTWTESDWSFWAMVKMVFNLPGAIPVMLQAGIDGNGGPPADWPTMMQYATSNATTVNAQMVGQYGQGGGSALGGVNLLVIGAAAVGLWYLLQKT